MRGRTIIYLLILTMLAISTSASAMDPVAVSPGSDPSTTLRAVIGQACPTFSWSSMQGAVAYRVEVFEALTAEAPAYEDMEAMAEPLISKEIAAPALSWTPSSGECLNTGGSYVWYVQGIDSGTGHPEPAEGWSEGSVFEVDVSVSLAGVQEAVEGTVNEYLTTKWLETESYRELKEGLTSEVVKETGRQSGTISILAFEGTSNTFFGNNAGAAISGNQAATFIGAGAGASNTTGANNTFVGRSAGTSNTTGYSNTFLGRSAGYWNTDGFQNTFIGRRAGGYNTSGYSNTFIGMDAGNSNTTGYYNTFLGRGAGYSNTTGFFNTFIGRRTGNSNTTGFYNTFLGMDAGYNNTTGYENTFIGRDSGYSNQTGAGNVFLGYNAGYSETGSNRLYIDSSSTTTPLIYGEFDNNTVTINGNLEVIGPDNGLVRLSNVTADSTVKVSRMVLRHYTNSELPVYLFGAASTGTDNFVAFGGGSAIGNAATQLDLYTAANTTTPVGTPRLTIIGNGNVGIGTQTPAYPLEMASGARVTAGGVWTNASSREYKDNIESLSAEKAMEALEGLNPVTFNYKADSEEQHAGFIAEDVPELVAMKDRKGLSPMDIVAVLTRVVKEQQKIVQEQQKVNQEQQKTITELSEEVKELKKEFKLKGSLVMAD